MNCMSNNDRQIDRIDDAHEKKLNSSISLHSTLYMIYSIHFAQCIKSNKGRLSLSQTVSQTLPNPYELSPSLHHS